MGFFANRRNKIISKAIEDAFLFNEGESVETNIHWNTAEKYAQEHGGTTDKYSDGGQTNFFKTIINNQKVSITLVRHRLNGTTVIHAENSEKQLNRFREKFGINNN